MNRAKESRWSLNKFVNSHKKYPGSYLMKEVINLGTAENVCVQVMSAISDPMLRGEWGVTEWSKIMEEKRRNKQ
jgi:hypothetical protein